MKHVNAIYLMCKSQERVDLCVRWACAYLQIDGHLSWHNDKNPFMHKSQAEMKLIRKKDRKDSCSSTYNAPEPGLPILLVNVTKNVWWKNISLN